MSLTQQIKADLLQSRKEKNELKSNILRVLLGEIELESCKTGVELPDEKVHSLIRKIIESNKQTYGLQSKNLESITLYSLNRSSLDNSALDKLRDMIANSNGVMDIVWGPDLELKETHPLLEENIILSAYLPTLLTHEEILSLITPELQTEILSADEKSLGKFTGKILKIVKEKGLTSNGNDVGSVIKAIRA